MIGVDISDETIKIVQLSAGRQKKLLSHCMQELPPTIMVNGTVVDGARMQQELKKALSSCRIVIRKNDPIVASISETQSFSRVLEIPEMKEDEVQEAVRWGIAQHIPFGLDNVYVDWQPVPNVSHAIKPGHMEVQVGAAQKKVVDSLMAVFQGIGVEVAAFELESQAIVRALIDAKSRAKHGLLIIDLGSTATNVIIFDEGATRFTASLDYGVRQMTKPLSPQDGRDLMDHLHNLPSDLLQRVEEKLSSSLDAIVHDIKGIVDFYNQSDSKHQVKEIILTGGGSNIPMLDSAFLKYFENVLVQRGNPWVNTLSAKDHTHLPMGIQESARYSTALGLALREVIVL